ncbi:hypothetical protein [Flagellimonas oceanensis]|uniref:hypothetical protein n=1 Tax=Flagellimonas oceanensis TaxID=2499163 RepID=UPI000F8F5BA9|nr:hypothetical protein [Allomuricauda oceanensis]
MSNQAVGMSEWNRLVRNRGGIKHFSAQFGDNLFFKMLGKQYVYLSYDSKGIHSGIGAADFLEHSGASWKH